MSIEKSQDLPDFDLSINCILFFLKALIACLIFLSLSSLSLFVGFLFLQPHPIIVLYLSNYFIILINIFYK